MSPAAPSKSASPKSAHGVPAELGQILARTPPPSVILITAPDEVRKRRLVEHLIQKFSKGPGAEVHRINASQFSAEHIARLADAASALSLFAKQEFSWIRNLEECPSGLTKHFPKLLGRYSENHVALFTATELPASNPVLEYCKKDKSLIPLEALKGFELHRWVERELRRAGFKEANEDAITTLIAAAEEHVDSLAGMVEHLWLYCESPALTKEDVHSVFIHKTVPGEFDFLDALVGGNIGRAEVMISGLLASGKSPFMLMALLNRSFSNYLSIRSLLDEGQNTQDVRQTLGLTPWVFNKQMPIARRYSSEDLLRGLKTLVSVDSKLKNRSLSPDVLIPSSRTLRPSLCAMLWISAGLVSVLSGTHAVAQEVEAAVTSNVPQAAPQAETLPNPAHSSASEPQRIVTAGDYRGWDYLAQKLLDAGTSDAEVARIFTDPRMPSRTPVPFKLKPKETNQMYSGFTAEPRLRIARECLAAHASAFEAAEKTYQVSRHVLAALILIETHCGRIVGDNLIINRLARVSSVGEPKNITFNLEQLLREDNSVTREQVESRARYLEETFFPEVQAIFEVAEKKNVDIFDLKGSVAGAFGIPQFLPSSYLKFGVDGNHDGKVWLFDPEDGIASAAHYLHSFGWKDQATAEEKKKVLWNYNRSDAYGDAVLKVAILLKQPHMAMGKTNKTSSRAAPSKAAPKASHKSATKKKAT
jgi:membrane-bound lytic murein transglycosylase B